MAGSELEPYRWTLDEYVLRCEQGTDIREIVVEGEIDRDVVVDALGRWGADSVSVLDEDYIHVERDQVEAAGFLTGAKGRLLTIAAALDAASRVSRLRASVVVVADRNYDDAPALGDCLLLTDGYSVESYAFSPSALDRFARLLLGRGERPRGSGGRRSNGRRTCSGEDLYRRVAGASIRIAAVRLTLRRLEDPPGLFNNWSDYVSVSPDGQLTADDQRLLQNVLQHAGRGSQREQAEERLPQEAERVSNDVFRLVRGHDFVSLLLKLLRSSWGRRVTGAGFAASNQAHLTRLLLLSVDPGLLDTYPLFVELRVRFSAAEAA